MLKVESPDRAAELVDGLRRVDLFPDLRRKLIATALRLEARS